MSFKDKMNKKATGLTDLLNDDTADLLIKDAKNTGRFLTVQADLLYPDPTQPRKSFDDSALMELRISIESIGQLQAVLVRPADSEGRYKIIAGERRWRAISGSSEVKTIDLAIVPADKLSEFMVKRMQRAENVDREPLTAIEHAESLAELVALGKADGMTQADVARAERMSPTKLSKHLSLLNAPDVVKQLSRNKETQDVETLYNLAQLADKHPEKVGEIIDAWRSGEIEGNLRQASKNALSGKDDKPAKEQGETSKAKKEEQQDLPLDDSELEKAADQILADDSVEDAEEEPVPQHVSHVANNAKVVKLGNKTFLDVEFTNKAKGEDFVLHFEIKPEVLAGLVNSLTSTDGISVADICSQ